MSWCGRDGGQWAGRGLLAAGRKARQVGQARVSAFVFRARTLLSSVCCLCGSAFCPCPPLRPSQVEAIKAEMRECVSRVTRGRALLDLAAVFQVRSALLVGM